MMKSKVVRGIINGGVLAAVAALGITVYQIGTKPITEESQKEESVQMEETEPENSEEEEAQDTVVSGNSRRTGAGKERSTAKNDAEETDVMESGAAAKETESAGSTANKNASAENVTTGKNTADGTAENVITGKNTADNDADSAENTDGTETAETSASGIAAQNLNFTEDSVMEWPVRGTVLVDYNMNETVYYPTLDQYRVSPAIALQAVEDAPVYAAADGQVLSVEQDACTGTTVTMELGNGYQAVYGQLKDLTVEEGDTVKEGTVIGNINTPTKYYSVEGPNLYFAMKKDGVPVDPFEYLE